MVKPVIPICCDSRWESGCCGEGRVPEACLIEDGKPWSILQGVRSRMISVQKDTI